jgi:hypothetical protein
MSQNATMLNLVKRKLTKKSCIHRIAHLRSSHVFCWQILFFSSLTFHDIILIWLSNYQIKMCYLLSAIVVIAAAESVRSSARRRLRSQEFPFFLEVSPRVWFWRGSSLWTTSHADIFRLTKKLMHQFGDKKFYFCAAWIHSQCRFAYRGVEKLLFWIKKLSRVWCSSVHCLSFLNACELNLSQLSPSNKHSKLVRLDYHCDAYSGHVNRKISSCVCAIKCLNSTRRWPE